MIVWMGILMAASAMIRYRSTNAVNRYTGDEFNDR